MLGLGKLKNRVQQNVLYPPVANTTNPQLEERRRSSRVEIEMLLTATTANGTQFYGYTRDLSREGTLAFVRGELAIGEEISLNFRTFQGAEDVPVKAIVRSAVGERYGIEFCDASTTEHDDLLVSMCKQHAFAEFAGAGDLVCS